MAAKAEAEADRTGYTVTEQAPPTGGQTTYRVTRDSDGTGLGAYHDDAGVDAAITDDRKRVADADKARAAAAKTAAKPQRQRRSAARDEQAVSDAVAETARAQAAVKERSAADRRALKQAEKQAEKAAPPRTAPRPDA
jgi:hypothetical protein